MKSSPLEAARTPSIALVLTAIVAVSSHAADWPQWLGPERDQISRETGWRKDWGEKGPPRLWEKPIGSGYSGIVVARGHLVVFHRVDDENRIESLDPETGERQWGFSYSTSYVDRYGYDGGPRACPIVAGDTVLTLDPDGIIHAIRLENGEKIWSRNLRREYAIEQNHFGTGAAPLVEDGVVYLHIGGRDFTRGTGQTFALSASDGKVLWKTPNNGGSYASPSLATIHDKKHLFVFHRGGLSSYDPADGTERWMYEWHSRSFESVNAATPLVAGDLVFFSATYGTGSVCLRVQEDGKYEEVWRDDLEKRDKALEIHWAPPIYLDGHVYGFSGRHAPGATLNCVELATGKVRWKWESFLHRGSMIYSDGHFIAMGELGDLVLLELSPEGHEVVAQVPRVLAYPAWTVPTLANGRLYLRDVEHLICFDVRPEAKEGAGSSTGKDEDKDNPKPASRGKGDQAER